MTRFINRTAVALVGCVALTMITSTAKADRFDVRIGDNHRPEMRRVWVEPVYQERCERVWVEPVYQTIVEPVFVRGYFKTVCDRVYVQPVFEYRDVVRFEHGHRVMVRERVCVREGGWQNVERQEWVPPHTRNETRQVLVRAGHFETRTNRVCVREGRWEMVPAHGNGYGHRHDDNVSFRLTLGF